MSYCVNCGVELGISLKACPLFPLMLPFLYEAGFLESIQME